jgi:hypothetical protein
MNMANEFVGGARAALGQGLGMGWGDEAEAWLRSKLGGGSYDENLAKIRSEYAQYAERNPFMSGALEFAGGVAPGMAAMFVPGGQVAGAAQIGRSTAGALGKIAASPTARAVTTGTVTGGISGAGSATEGQRGSGATTGAIVGGGAGVVLPPVMKGTGAAGSWLRDRLLPTESVVQSRAAEKVNRALAESNLPPGAIAARMSSDRALGVPSVVANTDPALADLAKAVAQRTGPGTRRVEKALTAQKLGARERTQQQVTRGLQPGDFYADEQQMIKDLRDKAKTVYDDAYAVGDVDDPRITEILKHPSFQGFFAKARQIAETEGLAAKLRGEDPSKYALPEIYKPSGRFDANGNEILELARLPDVRTLDYIKRGIDATIDSGFKGQGMSTAEASALRDLRRMFVGAIDENVPQYQAARQAYAGDMEVLDALRTGMNDFGKLDHEQVIELVGKMGNAEKQAFRTGVARDLYSRIMDPSRNFNAAERVIGSPEMQAKLMPLFDNPAEFQVFRAALTREAQLFHQANKVLGGSETAKNLFAREALDEGPGVGESVAHVITGGWSNALSNLALRALRSGQMSQDVSAKIADMLMSKNPAEVAAVVKLLEEQAARSGKQATRATATQMGTVSGTAAAIAPAPAPEGVEQPAIDEEAPAPTSGPDIESDIAAEEEKRKK